MKKTVSVIIAVALALAALGLAGCSEWLKDPMVDANKAIVKANTALKRFADSDKASQELQGKLNDIQVGPEGGKQALEITAQLRTEMDTQRAALTEAKTAILSIKKLEVRDEFKKYADLEAAAIDARLAILDEGAKLYDEMDKLYTAIRDKKASTAMTQEVLTAIDEITNRITLLTDGATAKTKAAADYFAKQKLGGK